jgi:ribulose bisphosphate carboxylase small subunit
MEREITTLSEVANAAYELNKGWEIGLEWGSVEHFP